MKMTNQEIGMLRIIADSVNEYLKNKSITKPENSSVIRTMEMVMPKLFTGYKFEIKWYYSKEPFIACIHPDIEELYEKSEDLMDVLNDPKKGTNDYLEKWCSIKKWYIDIDPRILTKGHAACVDDGNQFVAIIMHEIGHVMNRDPIGFIENYRKRMITVSRMERMMMHKNPIVRKLILPMFVHTEQFKLIVTQHEREQIEIAADAYVPDEFKGDLVAYTENHILPYPDTHGILCQKTEYDGEQEMAIKYSISTIELMKRRRDILKRQINTQYHSPDSTPYMKALMTFIGKAVGEYDPNSDTTQVMTESYTIDRFNRYYDEICTEADAVLEAVKVTDRDLTMLEIEAEQIKTPEDKLYIIQIIYDYLEAISKQQADRYKKLSKTMSKSDIEKINLTDERVERLNRLRTKVMAMQTQEYADHYGVFVRYPKGYEG